MIKKVIIIYKFEVDNKPISPGSHLLNIMYKMAKWTTRGDDIEVKANLDTVVRIEGERAWFESRKNHNFYSVYVGEQGGPHGWFALTSIVIAVKKNTFSQEDLGNLLTKYDGTLRKFKSVDELIKIREMYK